jgi:hypothetical protein
LRAAAKSLLLNTLPIIDLLPSSVSDSCAPYQIWPHPPAASLLTSGNSSTGAASALTVLVSVLLPDVHAMPARMRKRLLLSYP